jgi:hypothetical protein
VPYSWLLLMRCLLQVCYVHFFFRTTLTFYGMFDPESHDIIFNGWALYLLSQLHDISTSRAVIILQGGAIPAVTCFRLTVAQRLGYRQHDEPKHPYNIFDQYLYIQWFFVIFWLHVLE